MAKFVYHEATVKDAFPNEHAELQFGSEYQSEWGILADMFDEGSTESPWRLYTAVEVKEDGLLDTSGASNIKVLHLHEEGWVAVLNNAYTTWAEDRGDDIQRMLDIYYNDQEEWQSRG